jgi:hypothetical protein
MRFSDQTTTFTFDSTTEQTQQRTVRHWYASNFGMLFEHKIDG